MLRTWQSLTHQMHTETVMWNTTLLKVGVTEKEGSECLLSICCGTGRVPGMCPSVFCSGSVTLKRSVKGRHGEVQKVQMSPHRTQVLSTICAITHSMKPSSTPTHIS